MFWTINLDDQNQSANLDPEFPIEQDVQPSDSVNFIVFKFYNGSKAYFIGKNIFSISLGSLKNLIENKLGYKSGFSIKERLQRLIFGGKQFPSDDDALSKPLSEYGLSQEKNTIHLVIRQF
jgi:hypothetical protein